MTQELRWRWTPDGFVREDRMPEYFRNRLIAELYRERAREATN